MRGAERERGSYGSKEAVAAQRRMRKVEGEEEAQERGSQRGCLGHGRNCCRRPRPGSLSLHWTELHSPVMEDRKTQLINYYQIK